MTTVDKTAAAAAAKATKLVGRKAAKADAARLELEEAMRAAAAHGVGLRSIAGAAGLSPEGVRKIIARTS